MTARQQKTITSILLAFGGGLVAWGVSIEVRFSRQKDYLQLEERFDRRITHIEELMYPLQVEFQVEQRLKQLRPSVPVPIAVPPDEPDDNTWTPLPDEELDDIRSQVRQEVTKFRGKE